MDATLGLICFIALFLIIALVFTYRLELHYTGENLLLRMAILLDICRGKSTFADLFNTQKFRERRRDCAVKYLEDFIASTVSRLFMAEHTHAKEDHFAYLWSIGEKDYSYNFSAGVILYSIKQFKSMPCSADEALDDLCKNRPYLDPFFVTVRRLFYVKHAIENHDEFDPHPRKV